MTIVKKYRILLIDPKFTKYKTTKIRFSTFIDPSVDWYEEEFKKEFDSEEDAYGWLVDNATTNHYNGYVILPVYYPSL